MLRLFYHLLDVTRSNRKLKNLYSAIRGLNSIRVYFLLFLLVSSSLSAEIYHWTDSKGVRHYSDRPKTSNQSLLRFNQEKHFNQEQHSSLKQLYRPDTNIHVIPKQKLPKPIKKAPNLKEKQQQKQKQKIQEAKIRKKLDKLCRGYEKKLKAINAKLRRKHNNSQGNQWRKQRRHYQKLRWESCR